MPKKIAIPVTSSSAPSRVSSLDQFRGWTVLGMFFVNFMGHFTVIPAVFKHHNTYCSFADLIMPQFFFAVGLAYRLTYLRGVEKMGIGPTCLKMIQRNLGLILLGLVVYVEGNAKPWQEFCRDGLTGAFGREILRNAFQTLVHIGVTALWILPVIGARPLIRILHGCLSAGLHLYLSWLFYFVWVNTPPRGIDGGWLGFLSWSLPMLTGSLAWDALVQKPDRAVSRLLLAGGLLMGLGYGLSCVILPPQTTSSESTPPAAMISWTLVEPPLVPPASSQPKDQPTGVLQMSQRTGAISYQIFASGFSLALYGLFVLVCDPGNRWNLGFFRTLGNNALAAYLIHDLVGRSLGPFAPRDAPLEYTLLLFGIYLGIITLFLRYLEKRQLFLRL